MKMRIVKITTGLVAIMLLAFGGKKLIDAVNVDSDISSISDEVSAKSDMPSVIIDSEGIKSNANAWYSFVAESKSNKATSIRIQYQYDKSTLVGAIMPDVCLEFDGEGYFTKGSKEKYKYLLQLNGRSYNAAHDSMWVVLANKKYTYQDIDKSVYSSNSNDHIPYALLFTKTL